MTNFGDRLKQAIEARNLKQQDVAFDLRVDPALLSKVINGLRKPPEKLVEALAAYGPLGLSKEDLVSWQMLDQYTPEQIEAAIRLYREIKARERE